MRKIGEARLQKFLVSGIDSESLYRKKQHGRFAEIIDADKASRYITALSHELSTFPTSITKDGKMFHANKADLVAVIVTKAQGSKKASQYTMYSR